MKTNEFFDAMDNIDPALIERADKKTVKHRSFLKLAAIAASFAILVAGLVAVLPMLLGGEGLIAQDVIVWDDIFTMFSPGNGDGLTVGENNGEEEIIIAETAFAEIVSENYTDYKIGSLISPVNAGSYIGKKLGEVDIRSGWYLRAEGVEKDVMTVKAEVYEMIDVSPKAAVAIRYLEKCAANSDYFSNIYYVAVNEKYELTTLSQVFADLNAETYMSMTTSAFLLEFPDSPGENLNIDKYVFKDGTSEKIREIILSLDGDGEIMGYYDGARVSLKKGTKTLQLAYTLKTSNPRVNHIYVFENGTIAIRGLGDGVAIFNIGVDSTDALFAAFAENAVRVAGEYGEDDLVEATTGAVNE